MVTIHSGDFARWCMRNGTKFIYCYTIFEGGDNWPKAIVENEEGKRQMFDFDTIEFVNPLWKHKLESERQQRAILDPESTSFSGMLQEFENMKIDPEGGDN